MLVRLKVTHGPSAGKEIKIVQTPFVIGRQDDCQLRPKSDAISRRHCELVIVDSQLIARDLGSKNGTYVNGDRIVGDRVLRFGDHLKVGPLEFEVAIEVGITGEKRPKVTGVKDVALRSGDSSFGEADVSSWLDEPSGVEKARPTADAETRQFKLEKTDRLELTAGGGQEATRVDDKPVDGDKKAADPLSPAAQKLEELKRQEVGKLQPKAETTTANSREAAADALKKFFNRR